MSLDVSFFEFFRPAPPLHPLSGYHEYAVPIQVETLDPTTFRVTVDGRSTTTHTVTVRPDYADKLGATDSAMLVERSFEFLLEREPNTSILSQFELSVIQRYFPEYEQTIGSLL